MILPGVSTFRLLLVLRECPYGATYEGLRTVLRYQSHASVRTIVRHCEHLGLVNVIPTGIGRGCKTVIKLSPTGKEFLT